MPGRFQRGQDSIRDPVKAFVPGAGLGVRMGELTEWLPKPLLPVWRRPLASFALDHLLEEGVESFVVNTHHCASAYERAFPEHSYRGRPVRFVYEPELLDTGGGLANAAGFLGDSSFFIHNGDILCSTPLDALREAHVRGGFEVTLLLRSTGPSLQVGWDPESGLVRSIRSQGGDGAAGPFQFTGVYIAEPAFLDRLGPPRPFSVIAAFLAMIREGAGLGAIVDDEGFWADLGDPESYRRIQVDPLERRFPHALTLPRIHPHAELSPEAEVDAWSIIGSGARVARGAVVRESVLWPGAEVGPDERVERRVVRGRGDRHRFFDCEP